MLKNVLRFATPITKTNYIHRHEENIEMYNAYSWSQYMFVVTLLQAKKEEFMKRKFNINKLNNLILTELTEHKTSTTHDVRNPCPGCILPL